MPVFDYKFIDSGGKAASSRLESASEEQARATLRNQGRHVVQLRLVSGGAGSTSTVRRQAKGKVPVDEQATVFRQMAILIRAGISLTDALHGLQSQVKNRALQEALSGIHDDLVQGMSFSEAVSRHPAVFPRLASDMISIAEAGGTLYEALDRLAIHLESSADIARKIKSATMYPIAVIMISILTLIALVTFILPRFLQLFKQMNVELPMSTKMLMALSQSTRQYWFMWVGSAVLIVLAFKKFSASPSGRMWLDSTVLKLPVLGTLVTQIIVTRSMTALGTLLRSGVPMISALETAAAAANNEVVRLALRQAQSDVTAGTTITNSLKRSGVFPPLILQMVAAGEKSGELPEMLACACDHYEKDIDAKLRGLTSIIEPILIVGLGAFVGFIALSIIVPIYSLVGGVK